MSLEALVFDFDGLILDTVALQPGAGDLITAASTFGLALAVASSSPIAWVEGHLERRGLLDAFDTVVGRDHVARTKPDPELYATAVDRLGIDPAQAVALEDSHHGTVAARAAGLACVAVPNRVTSGQDFSAARLVVDSLADLTIPQLEDLV